MGSTSTALGAGTSPVSAFTAGVFLGVGISIVAMGGLLQYMYEMGQRSSVAGDRANAEPNEHDQANGIAPPSSGDQTDHLIKSLQALRQAHFWPQQMLVAFEVAPSEFAATSSGHEPATHFTMADVFVATYSMVEDLISFASSF